MRYVNLRPSKLTASDPKIIGRINSSAWLNLTPHHVDLVLPAAAIFGERIADLLPFPAESIDPDWKVHVMIPNSGQQARVAQGPAEMPAALDLFAADAAGRDPRLRLPKLPKPLGRDSVGIDLTETGPRQEWLQGRIFRSMETADDAAPTAVPVIRIADTCLIGLGEPERTAGRPLLVSSLIGHVWRILTPPEERRRWPPVLAPNTLDSLRDARGMVIAVASMLQFN